MLSKNKRAPIYLMFIPFIILGCFGKSNSTEQKIDQKGSIYKSDKDVPIPNQLIEQLEIQYLKAYRLENPDSPLTDMQLTLQVPRRLLQLSVQLIEKNEGTLSGNTEFRLPLGGAAIDLGESVVGEKGIFYVKIEVGGLSSDQLENVKVYFVSNSKKMKVKEEIYGAGCGHFYDISQFYHKVLSKAGHEVAAADYRYLGQLVGTFFFFYAESDAFYVGSTSFIDSRFPETHCLFPESR